MAYPILSNEFQSLTLCMGISMRRASRGKRARREGEQQEDEEEEDGDRAGWEG